MAQNEVWAARNALELSEREGPPISSTKRQSLIDASGQPVWSALAAIGSPIDSILALDEASANLSDEEWLTVLGAVGDVTSFLSRISLLTQLGKRPLPSGGYEALFDYYDRVDLVTDQGGLTERSTIFSLIEAHPLRKVSIDPLERRIRDDAQGNARVLGVVALKRFAHERGRAVEVARWVLTTNPRLIFVALKVLRHFRAWEALEDVRALPPQEEPEVARYVRQTIDALERAQLSARSRRESRGE